MGARGFDRKRGAPAPAVGEHHEPGTPLDLPGVRRLIEVAVAEDLGAGDVTTRVTVPPSTFAEAEIVARVEGVAAGFPVAAEVFRCIAGDRVRFRACFAEGARFSPGATVARISGPAADLLAGERVALNFLQRLCGIATSTARFVEAVAGTRARIVDTRKTTPGLRALEKYAVRVGGGNNHRFGLGDGILIKDNHIAAAGGLAVAVERARRLAPHTLRVQVECRTLAEVAEALTAGADAILLDNMPLPQLREAVRLVGGKALLEASGGVSLETVRAVAEAGVDLISVGALTHSAPAVDLSLRIVARSGPGGAWS